MNLNKQPFNIDLLTLNQDHIKHMSRINKLDIFDGSSNNFHPEGLFSTEIFGRVGDEIRNKIFAYIKLNSVILHPLVYKTIISLRAFYKDILSGNKNAIFNEKIMDFEESDQIEGETGYSFFMKHYKKINLVGNKSTGRDLKIELINKHKKNSFMEYLLVMPAGLRDYEVDDDGKSTQDEINTFYKKVISNTNLLEHITDVSGEEKDVILFNLQNSVLNIYTYIVSLLDGKKKLIQGKWTSRNIFDSTRNVITSYPHTSKTLNGDTSVGTTSTAMGLYQFLRNTLPLSINKIQNGLLSEVLPNPNGMALLTDKKTLELRQVEIDGKDYDEYMSYEGLESVLSKFKENDIRHSYVVIKDHYIGLIYKDDKYFKMFKDIKELPDRFDKRLVEPITLTELLYLSVYKNHQDNPCVITRYPVTSYGSIYPGYLYLKTTNKSEVKIELDDAWEPSEYKATEFPIKGESFFSTLGISSKHLDRLGADFDGDTCSSISFWTEESKIEIKKLMNDRKFYVEGKDILFFKSSTSVIDLVLSNITG